METTTARRLTEADEQLHLGEVLLDRAAYRVTVCGRPVGLAMQEYRLLELLRTVRGVSYVFDSDASVS